MKGQELSPALAEVHGCCSSVYVCVSNQYYRGFKL